MSVSNSIRSLFDKAAIALSAVCIVHCVALLLGLALFPALAMVADEHVTFHEVLLFFVLPTSVVALVLGCLQHRQWRVLMLGAAGLALLITGTIVGHYLLGEGFETGATIAGACLIAMSHFSNFRYCRKGNTDVC